MAIEPQNLIQVQSSLQDPFTVKNEDLIKYANGSNPEVPAFLALIEMNRRKQIEEGSAALDTTKGTIKDQVAGALTAPPSGVNPTANPYTVNPAAAPNMVNPAANPFDQGITQLPQGFNPTQAPPMQQPSPARPVMAAGGGLMSLPVNHFNESSYAGGGIVAFKKGDVVGKPDPEQFTHITPKGQAEYVNPEGAADYGLIPASLDESDAERWRLATKEFEARRKAGSPLLESAGTSLVNLPTDETPVPKAAPVAKPKPGSYEGILAALPKAPEISIPAPTALTREQAFENIKENQRLAGVVENPYEEVNKRQAAKEKREQEVYERGGIDRLIAQASAFAKADPARGIGYQGAVAAEASAVLQKEQDIIRDKQETAAIEFRKSIAKEEDAKRRGDAAGIEAAVTAREKAQSDYEKLRFDAAKVQNDRGTLAEKIFSAGNTAEYQKGMLGYYNRMAASTEEQKPTAEDRKLLKVQTTVNAHPVVRGIADAIKQGMITPGTPEYYEALKRINEIAKPLYRQAGLPEPEDIIGDITPPAAPKPGFWESVGSIFGGSSTPQKAVPFNQLPK
jgi:hypothetical protein